MLDGGILAEYSFRDGLRGIVEKYFGGKIATWGTYDKEEKVYGHPSLVEIDLLVRDREHILVEIKSSVSMGDVAELLRIGQLYEEENGIKPKLVIVSPYVDDRARKLAKEIGIEVYTPAEGPLLS